jgi:hypothetical protein
VAAALPSVALVAATIVELGRQSGLPAWQTMWAEDGTIFLADAVADPFPSTLWQPYAGYMLIVPRLAAEIMAAFPLEDAAWIDAVLASGLVASVAIFVYFASSTTYNHRASRVALATMIVLVPVAGFEATANLANVHWYLVFACYWALVYSKTSLGSLAARTAFAFAAPMSNPLAALFAPVALLNANRRMPARELIPRLAFFIGVTLQAIVVLNASDETPSTPFDPRDLPEIFGGRVAGSFFIGDRFLHFASQTLGSTFIAGSFVGLAILAMFVVRALDGRQLRFAFLTVTYAVIFLVVPLVVRGSAGYWPLSQGALNGSRYFILPVLFLFVGFFLYVDVILVGHQSGRRTTFLTIVLLWIITVVLLNYSFSNPRSIGPDWRSSLYEARIACTHGLVGHIDVPISPPGWSVRLPCRA